jgi:hypothetical protein
LDGGWSSTLKSTAREATSSGKTVSFLSLMRIEIGTLFQVLEIGGFVTSELINHYPSFGDTLIGLADLFCHNAERDVPFTLDRLGVAFDFVVIYRCGPERRIMLGTTATATATDVRLPLLESEIMRFWLKRVTPINLRHSGEWGGEL